MPTGDKIDNFLDLLIGMDTFLAAVNEQKVPTTPFCVRGNSGRLWECTELVKDTEEKWPHDKSRWQWKARSIGNSPQIEDTLYALQLLEMYGLYDKDGKLLVKGEYDSPQEMYNAGTPSSYDEDKNYRPNLAVKEDLN